MIALHPSRRLLAFAGLLLIVADIAGAQQGTGRVAGIVLGDGWRPVPEAFVMAEGRGSLTDGLGRFDFRDLKPGKVHLAAVRDGWEQLDTVVELRPGATVRWNPRFPESRSSERLAEIANRANGAVDSAGRRLVRVDTMLAAAYAPFTARFTAAVLRDRPASENVVVSPLGARLALGLVASGARGETAREMTTALTGRAADPASLAPLDARVTAALRRRTDVQLEVANALWLDTRLTARPEFVRTARERYGSTVRTGTLSTAQTLAEMNRWASEATHGLIKQIRGEPLPDSTRALVANAVYFKGTWLEKFDKSRTKPRTFKLASGRRIEVPMMERTGDYAYARGRGWQMVRLPYRAGLSAMYVVLPDSNTTPDALVARFEREGWPRSLDLRAARELHLVLPRVHVEQSFSLLRPLTTMEMRRALDCDVADFSGIASDTLCIGEAAQKVYLHLDEAGTEAAAVTSIAMVRPASVPPPPPDFVVDRPFLLMLRDERTGVDLFVGRIAKP